MIRVVVHHPQPHQEDRTYSYFPDVISDDCLSSLINWTFTSNMNIIFHDLIEDRPQSLSIFMMRLAVVPLQIFTIHVN